jgi:hypothetical protein
MPVSRDSMVMMRAEAAGAPTPTSPGEIIVRADVSLEYSLQ